MQQQNSEKQSIDVSISRQLWIRKVHLVDWRSFEKVDGIWVIVWVRKGNIKKAYLTSWAESAQRKKLGNLKKARLINDVRYQDWTEMTLADQSD